MVNNSKIIDLLVRLLILGVIIFSCFTLLRPFISIALWGTILAIALFPVFQVLKNVTGGRANLAVTIIVLVAIAIIIGPVSLMAKAFADNAQSLLHSLESGTLFAPLPEDITNLPLIGKPLENFWQLASTNLKQVVITLEPQIKKLATSLLVVAANVGLGLLQFILSIILAAGLMLNEKVLKRQLTRTITRITPAQGQAFIELASSTLRNVIRGVIGVAAIQTLMIGIGLIVAGIPSAGLLTLLCLVLSLIQIGPGIIVVGTLIFAWAKMSTLTALLLTIWLIPATLVDNVLKPILMGRGLPVPMLVILIGVFGGTITYGILGLFIGPVVLTLGYELAKGWLNQGIENGDESETGVQEMTISG
jgi:predicted PurR-regulated permease PerM